jgi:hypothetical protein
MQKIFAALFLLCAVQVLLPTAQSTIPAAQVVRYRTLPIDIDVRPDAPIPVRGDDGRRNRA